ncbi:MAG: HAMP domain-containing histidine kinase [Chitinophagaceae bacterium]|mgnify:FL=1|nr:HAMP domain-containing histidine kinase [Chitinophagaceae bacterium]MBP6476894.1 HAMP domain-containing histidine kinase [Chitinophagaceae bacterium]MBP7108388.1 HAMP domain-containing histidine kinase [Chitinophagaceae bacterium]MBP7314128.1 HAMP domain-containing histidine kinase [Chitinophagaceae bacterium]HQV54120.1 HAMP domain-containing sensor histidine kinase [Chitinophagaceae bacterium]
MFRQILNWRTALAVIAIFIISGTIFYSQYLARKIAKEEKQKVEQWIEAVKFLISSSENADVKLAAMITTQNTSIPIIEANEKDSILQFINLDSTKSANDISYVQRKLKQFKSQNNAVVWVDPFDSTKRNLYYYGDSKLLNEVRYYPIVQLIVVALFIIITLLSLRSSYRSVQNQVWAGMAKETAHQLGTPVSSLEGWVEMLRDKPGTEKIIQELEKDVNRLRLVSDRFGKIGSTPQLEQLDLVSQINSMVDYMRKRATGKIIFTVGTNGKQKIEAAISAPLFDWVIENLLKNALDSMEGKGSISVDMNEGDNKVTIDITDTGKGISSQNISRVFKPGFTTKKRGWGLGLSLSKRIIEQYHKGEIYVKSSETGKGTTFRIVLKK